MDKPTDDRIECPECSAGNPGGAIKCWSCDEPLPSVNPFLCTVHPDRAAQETQPTFTLASLLLIITMVAVCLAIAVQAPGIGIPLAFLSAPALVRTILVRAKRRNRGEPMNATDKSLVFLGSLAIVTTIGAAACAAFCAICFSMGLVAFEINSTGLFVVAWTLGIVAGLLVGGLLFRALWWIRY
jgi:hypothetical protein